MSLSLDTKTILERMQTGIFSLFALFHNKIPDHIFYVILPPNINIVNFSTEYFINKHITRILYASCFLYFR